MGKWGSTGGVTFGECGFYCSHLEEQCDASVTKSSPERPPGVGFDALENVGDT